MNYRILSVPLTSRAVVQIDKAVSANHAIFWHQRKLRDDANLRSRIYLRSARYSDETIEHQRETLCNVTNSELNHARKIPYDQLFAKFVMVA